MLVNNNEYIEWFKSSYAADELCYITYLSYTYGDRLGEEIKATSYNSPPEIATTFANWEGMDYKYVSQKELKNYIHITQVELIHLLKSPCFFGRKFKPIAADGKYQCYRNKKSNVGRIDGMVAKKRLHNGIPPSS